MNIQPFIVVWVALRRLNCKSVCLSICVLQRLDVKLSTRFHFISSEEKPTNQIFHYSVKLLNTFTINNMKFITHGRLYSAVWCSMLGFTHRKSQHGKTTIRETLLMAQSPRMSGKCQQLSTAVAATLCLVTGTKNSTAGIWLVTTCSNWLVSHVSCCQWRCVPSVNLYTKRWQMTTALTLAAEWASTPCSQRSHHGQPLAEINYTAWRSCEWNNISFTDACVVVWLSHQAGISRQSLTVSSVRGTSSHRNYQTDLQYLRSLTRKHHQTDQTKSKNHLTFFFILGINHGWLSVNWTSRAGYNWTLIGDNATHFQLTFG